MTAPVSRNAYIVAGGTATIGVPIREAFSPTPQNVSYPLNQVWFNTATEFLYFLASFTSSDGVVTANWIEFATSSSTVLSVEGTAPITANGVSGSEETGNIVVAMTTPLAGQYGGTGVDNAGLTINLGSATSGYVLTSDSSGNATWEANAASLVWHAVTSNTNMVVGNGYVVQSSSGVTVLTLPTVAASAFGNIIAVSSYTDFGFKIAQNTGNQILVGNATTTSGTSGYIQTIGSTYNSLTLLCVFNNGTSGVWALYNAPQGNYTVI